MSDLLQPDPDLIEPILRLTRDLRAAAGLLDRNQARYLVDSYYQIQTFRLQTESQIRETKKTREPSALLLWIHKSMQTLENGIQNSLGRFAKTYRVGAWLQSICGVGPVISAGLLAHLDIRVARYAGNFWNFAGLNPSVKWEKGQKRPWCEGLKTLAVFKAGECFVKVQANEKDVYGKLYAQRKAIETVANEDGKFSSEAAAKLERFKIGKTTDAFKWYSGCYAAADVKRCRVEKQRALAAIAGELLTLDSAEERAALKAKAVDAVKKPKLLKPGEGLPMLPPAHIHARARRYAVKMFLSHVHHVMYEDYHGVTPPVPYGLGIEGHGEREVSYVPPPDWPGEHKGKSLHEMFAEEPSVAKGNKEER